MHVPPHQTLRPESHVACEGVGPGALEGACRNLAESEPAARKCGVTEVIELHHPMPSPEHRPAHRVHQIIAHPEADELSPVTVSQRAKSPSIAAVQENVLGVPRDVAIARWWTRTQAPVDARVKVYRRAEDDATPQEIVTSGCGARSSESEQWRCGFSPF